MNEIFDLYDYEKTGYIYSNDSLKILTQEDNQNLKMKMNF